LAIHPAAKALLDKVAQPDKTTQYQSTDALSQLFGTTSTAPASKDRLTTATTFLQAYKTTLQIQNPVNEFKELTSTPDKQGNTHIKLQQYWNDLPVWNSEVVVHANAKGVYAFNGRYYPSPNIPLESIKFSKEKARPTLMYYFNNTTNTFHLAWKVEFHTIDHEEWLFMIDTQDGKILKKVPEWAHPDR